ncbi:uncharacterized protein FPRN_02638 [Fusarium proliferatum]|nr:uncharacterized protein FPRN_02638 [Fusarium proliferatum]
MPLPVRATTAEHWHHANTCSASIYTFTLLHQYGTHTCPASSISMYHPYYQGGGQGVAVVLVAIEVCLSSSHRPLRPTPPAADAAAAAKKDKKTPIKDIQLACL